MQERFADRLAVVYLGPFETVDSCREWQQEYELPFDVIPDEGGKIFEQLSNGWVPYTILVGPDGKVILWESEFEEAGFAAAVDKLFAKRTEAPAGTERVISHPFERTPGAVGATVVVLGAGAGGLVAAHDLRRKLRRRDRVILVDRSPYHLFQSSLLWRAVGLRRPEQIRRPLSDVTRQGIELVPDEVTGIDVAGRKVQTSSRSIDFDFLIVALGAKLAPEAVEGFDRMALNLYDLEGSGKVKAALETFSGGKIGVLVTDMPFKCPAAPYEAALLVESFLRKKGVREKSQIHLYTPEHQPMPIAGPVLGEALTQVLAERNIHYHPLFTFERLDPSARTIVASGGEREKIDLLLAVPPHRAPDVVGSSGLIGSSGWMHADSHTLGTEHDRVYAIGDVNAIRLPNGKNLPMAGVFAHYQARVVAQRIADEIEGRTPDATFDGKGACWLELGGGKAAFASGNFYAEPEPFVRLHPPSRPWHWAKVLFEKWWLHHWF